jgi:hypothetical protein
MKLNAPLTPGYSHGLTTVDPSLAGSRLPSHRSIYRGQTVLAKKSLSLLQYPEKKCKFCTPYTHPRALVRNACHLKYLFIGPKACDYPIQINPALSNAILKS